MSVGRNPNDKILDNSYNTGNIEHENLKTPVIHNDYAENYLEESYSSEEYYRKKKIRNSVYKLVEISEFSIYLTKKIPKSELGRAFDFLKTGFVQKTEYTNVEFFTVVTEVFDITFENLYTNIYTIHKEELISELDSKFGVFKKRGINSLF